MTPYVPSLVPPLFYYGSCDPCFENGACQIGKPLVPSVEWRMRSKVPEGRSHKGLTRFGPRIEVTLYILLLVCIHGGAPRGRGLQWRYVFDYQELSLRCIWEWLPLALPYIDDMG